MSIYFELAYALASKRIAFFMGTGFSKCITNNAAPGWQDLLENCCDQLEEGAKKLKQELFPSGTALLPLEECAQIIHLRLRSENKDIHQIIAGQLAELKVVGDISHIKDFFKKYSFGVITTNYDKLIANDLAPDRCVSIIPGMPIPRIESNIKVYHIHGAIDVPSKMVVTSEDYFNFLNKASYFSNKWHTVLHENTIVIMGYSLADTNLKLIINDYRNNHKGTYQSNNLIFVSRDEIVQSVKDYYSHCYGIRVLDGVDINQFFNDVDNRFNEAKQSIQSANNAMAAVLNQGESFKDDYLRLPISFFEIISEVSAKGFSVDDPKVITMLKTILEKKIELTCQLDAWEQYDHLAEWLVYLGTILKLDGLPILDVYLEATIHSMETMSRKKLIGYSWQAYKTWQSGWPKLVASNRSLIKAQVNQRISRFDVLDIVNH